MHHAATRSGSPSCAGRRIAPGDSSSRPPREGPELERERDSISIGQIDIDQCRVRLQSSSGSQGPGNGIRLADDVQPGCGQDAHGQAPESTVVIDN